MSFKPKELSTVKKIDGRIPYYQSIIDCNPSASLKPLKDLCYLYSRIEFWYYEDPDGKRYYFNKKPDVEKGKQRLEYMDSVSVLSDNRIAVDKSSPLDPLNNRVFCQKIANLLGMLNDNTKFTEFGIRIIDVISHDSSLNDPVIKCQLMTTALECFSKSDKIVQEFFGTYIQQLDSVDVKNCNPFMAENGPAVRLEAERLLGRLKGIDKSIDEAQKRNQQLVSSFTADIIQPVGWLDKDGSQWTVRGIPAGVTGELYVIKQSGMVSVGTVKNKDVKLKSVSDAKRGFPVFIIKTIKPE